MTEYVEHLFNTCPECLPNGKRVFLEFKKGSDYTEPCRECGCKFGKILTPRHVIEERTRKAFG